MIVCTCEPVQWRWALNDRLAPPGLYIGGGGQDPRALAPRAGPGARRRGPGAALPRRGAAGRGAAVAVIIESRVGWLRHWVGWLVGCQVRPDGSEHPDAVSFVQVRKPPSWPRSRANSSLRSLYPHGNAWANLCVLGQPNTFLSRSTRQQLPARRGLSSLPRNNLTKNLTKKCRLKLPSSEFTQAATENFRNQTRKCNS